MAINVSQAFHRTSANPIDETLTLSKAEMLTVNDNLMPAYYFTVCQDDGALYLYDKSATASATTGKFKKYEGGGGGGVVEGYLNATDGQFYEEDTYTTLITAESGQLYLSLDTRMLYQWDGTKYANVSAPIRELTQAEYYALTNAERHNGTTYFVTDESGDSGGGSGGGIINGFYNPVTEKFYKDSAYTIEVVGEAEMLYHSVDTNMMYVWDSTENEFINVNTISKNITKVDYDALSTQEKNSGAVYYVIDETDDPLKFDELDERPEVADSTDIMTDVVTPLPGFRNQGVKYSTSEQVIGEWIDGKPLYQKTVNFGQLPDTTSKSVDHGIADVNEIIDIKAIIHNGTSHFWRTLNMTQDNDTTLAIVVQATRVSVQVFSRNKNVSVYDTCYITIQYTKTTD